MGEKIRRGQLSYWVTLGDTPETADPRSQRNSSALESLPYFCTSANMMSAIIYLSQELQGMGLSCPLIETGSQRVNLVALVNACWEVTHLYRVSVRDTNTLYDQRRRDAADLNHFQSNVRDLKGSVEEKERLVCDSQEKERQALSFSKTLATKLRTEKDEVRKLSHVMQQREAHHQHELRKKETENNRLRDRLHRMVSGEKSIETRTSGMSLSSSLTRHNRSRARWKTESSNARNEEDLHRRVLSQYEVWVGQLNDENDQLKSCLSSVSSQISKIVTKFAKSETQALLEGDLNTSMNSVFSSDSLENLVVSLEFQAIKDQMQHTFDHNLKTLTKILEERSATKRSKEVDGESQLKEELTESKVKGELALCSTTYNKEQTCEESGDSDLSFLADGRNVEERVSLDKTREEVYAERRLLQQERKRFSEATIRLNRERVSFEAEKVELLRRQFLQDLPSTLSDTGENLAISTLEGGESLSSGSLGDAFDTPKCLLSALPNLTSPQGNITYVQGSPPPVLGPTKLPPTPQQQQQHGSFPSTSSHKTSLYRLRSAPTSRASSISRQFSDGDDEPTSPHIRNRNFLVIPRLSPSRPRTLERDRPSWRSKTISPHSRSKSQSRGDSTKEKVLGKRLSDSCCSPYRQDNITLSPTRVSFQDDRGPSPSTSKEGIYSRPADYQEAMYNSVRPRTSQVARKRMHRVSCHEPYQFLDPFENEATETSSSVEALEADLVDLMDQIAHRYQGTNTSPTPPLSESPPPYEEVPQHKPRPKQVLSLLKSAPGSLSGSRRSSQDLSVEEENRKMFWCQGKRQNQY